MKLDAKRLRLYAVTDRAWAHDTEGLLRQVAAAIDGGAGIVQLREKHLGQGDFLAEAERFVALCREKGALSIINDNVEIAAQVGADGVHVGQEDLEAGRARELLGPDKLIGVSAHSVAEALAAQAAGRRWERRDGGAHPANSWPHRPRRCLAAAVMSGWAKRAETTATPAMPLPASRGRRSARMPPMATAGMSTA